MHFEDGQIPQEYQKYIHKKTIFLLILLVFLVFIFCLSLSLGAANLSLLEVVKSLCFLDVSPRTQAIVFNIRMPQTIAACLAGAGLAISGTVMQAILRNPMASPFTLGISQGAALGAAIAIMFFGGGKLSSAGGGNMGVISISSPFILTTMAFIGALSAAIVIILISKMRGAKPEIMVLAGLALSSLFSSTSMFLQYFADDRQLSQVVFWNFGDVARASSSFLIILSVFLFVISLYFILNAWNYNALEAGDHIAQSLGIRVEFFRLTTMILATLLTAVIISSLGVIGFVGLVVPHILRRIIGSDHRYLLPASLLGGAILLLSADIVARTFFLPNVLPVSILSAFLGAPVFLYLLLKGRGR